MYGIIPKAIWSRLVETDSENRIPLQTNCLFLERDGTRVLIETGYGDKSDAKTQSIFAMEDRSIRVALDEIDIAPESIDCVVLSHLHFDHAAGLTYLDSEQHAVSTFPNASIVVQQTEWDDALANKSTMKTTFKRDHLDPVAHQMKCVHGEVEIAPGLTVWPMPGHTWGQQAVRFEDSQGVIVFPGDVLPTVHHVRLAYSIAYDMEPYTNMESKRELLGRAAQGDWRLVLAHEPGNAVVRVAPNPAREGEFVLTTAGEIIA